MARVLRRSYLAPANKMIGLFIIEIKKDILYDFENVRNTKEYKRTSSLYGISRTSLLLSVISLCRRGVVDILILDLEA